MEKTLFYSARSDSSRTAGSEAKGGLLWRFDGSSDEDEVFPNRTLCGGAVFSALRSIGQQDVRVGKV
ncbi:MAG: hypothetical protein CMO55_14440 [Verrucomicrobiales bacterium]|nr:hypothetical protein [Verrucomicrobiales bacterium]